MLDNFYKNSLTEKNFSRLSACIFEHSGIKMPDSKKVMLEARLRKRLRDLNLNTFTEYCDFLFTREGMESELVHLIDVVTTNKTDFFREPKQFDFLYETALPALLENHSGIKRKFNIWSAGCSSGEEPYTVSMIMNEFSTNILPVDFTILGSDISTDVLRKASLAIYEKEKIEPVPELMLKKYFLKSKDKSKNLYRITPELRNKVEFKRINLMDTDFGFKEKFDFIFCRNVIIYFNKATQEELITKLIKHLVPGGYLFLGHSETIFNTNNVVNQVMASTYRKIK